MRPLALFASLPLLAAIAPAQHLVLMTSGAAEERTLALDLPEIDTIRREEIYEVFPLPGGAYSARPFLPVSLQWHYVGDLDNDGQYVEASTAGPAGSSAVIDEIFVKAGTTGPVTPRDVFFSISAASAVFGVLASDVVRYAAQGVREVFLTEAQLEIATGGTTLNLDALCQTFAGDLFFSFALTEALHFGSAADGDLLCIPAAAITYDGNGNVAAIVANSAVRVATEAQLLAMVSNSGFRQSNGTTAGTLFNLSGLELDPNGGTWVSPVDSNSYPNLLFCWRDAANDGAILSTAGGGSIAVINGVPMGSTVATTGAQIGWLPGVSGTSGPGGLALIPVQGPQFTLLNYPRNLHTMGDGQTFVQLQSSGGQPGSFTLMAWSVEGNVPGGAFPALPAVPPFVGEFGLLSPIIVGVYANDALGNAASPLIVLPTAVMSGVNLAAQALDIVTFELSRPSAMSFL
ncbi:MAG: hypothetical protein KF830_09955 [Planctomycetes bacterium]|nr:hypothetical protein [Planctomycetota bacterium]